MLLLSTILVLGHVGTHVVLVQETIDVEPEGVLPCLPHPRTICFVSTRLLPRLTHIVTNLEEFSNGDMPIRTNDASQLHLPHWSLTDLLSCRTANDSSRWYKSGQSPRSFTG